MGKVTPLTLVNVLQSKHKELKITEVMTEASNQVPGARPVISRYTVTIQVGAMPQLVAQATETSKQRARHVAAQ